jgi:hypothetical protein
MSVNQREWTFNCSTTWTQVLDIGNAKTFKHALVDNFGNVEIEIAFCSTDFPDFTVPGKSSKSIDDDLFLGKVYARRVGGLLNVVGRIRLW